jgi:hypothetical protein
LIVAEFGESISDSMRSYFLLVCVAGSIQLRIVLQFSLYAINFLAIDLALKTVIISLVDVSRQKLSKFHHYEAIHRRK